MNQYLDFLLQKYQITQDPVDAAAFANAFANNVSQVPINPYLLRGEIWVVDEFWGSDNGSDITLYLLEKDAVLHAAMSALEALRSDIQEFRNLEREERQEGSVAELHHYRQKLNELQTCQNLILETRDSSEASGNYDELHEAIRLYNADCNEYNLAVYSFALRLPQI